MRLAGLEGLNVVVATFVAAGFLLVAVPIGAPASADAQLVRATIWPNLVITFSPKTFRHGTVLMRVKNRTSSAHEFMINGVTWRRIRPHASVTNSVTFKRRGIYQATLPDCGYLSMCAPTAGDSGPTGRVRVT